MQTERTVRTIRCGKDAGSIPANDFCIWEERIEVHDGQEPSFDASQIQGYRHYQVLQYTSFLIWNQWYPRPFWRSSASSEVSSWLFVQDFGEWSAFALSFSVSSRVTSWMSSDALPQEQRLGFVGQWEECLWNELEIQRTSDGRLRHWGRVWRCSQSIWECSWWLLRLGRRKKEITIGCII